MVEDGIMENLVIVVVLLAVIVLSAGYIIKVKRNGGGCIGCPSAKNGGHSGCTCGCCGTDENSDKSE